MTCYVNKVLMLLEVMELCMAVAVVVTEVELYILREEVRHEQVLAKL